MSNKRHTRVLIKKTRYALPNYSGDRLRSVASLRDSTIRSQHPKTNTMCYLFKPPQSVTSASAKHTVRLYYACKRPGSLRNPLPPGGTTGPCHPRLASLSLSLFRRRSPGAGENRTAICVIAMHILPLYPSRRQRLRYDPPAALDTPSFSVVSLFVSVRPA